MSVGVSKDLGFQGILPEHVEWCEEDIEMTELRPGNLLTET